jgi:hypothetical protein
MEKGKMIQETEMQPRLARMAGPLKSIQFIDLSPEHEVPVQPFNSHRASGVASP